MRYKRRYNTFDVMQDNAIGIVKLGVISGVGAGVQSMAPAGTPSMMGGFSAMAGMVPIATTAGIGMSLLPRRKKSKY